MNLDNPCIVQSDRTLLVEVENPRFHEARNEIGCFAHLVKSPEYIHTYEITPLSLWNASALGIKPEEVVGSLEKYSKYDVPQNIVVETHELMSRYGKVVLEVDDGKLVLSCNDSETFLQIKKHPDISRYLSEERGENSAAVSDNFRGVLKQALIKIGFPAEDRAGYVDGEPFDLSVRKKLKSTGENFVLRGYQKDAAQSFTSRDSLSGGSGVVVLPCGAGKTIVGLYAMSLLKRRTLILATNIVAARQWRDEILDKTDISPDRIGEYSGEKKEIKEVTIATYQILTYSKKKSDPFSHFGIFSQENWGLIIYDEVHLLPAPVFKYTANIQARRRLGLTATLVREDGHEKDVFALIGPKKYDVPWKDLEKQGWIAKARCIEVRVELPRSERFHYISLPPKMQIRCAYENSNKMLAVEELLEKHKNEQLIIIGQYLSQIKAFAEKFYLHTITGSTPNSDREKLFNKFRSGEIKRLLLSKVGNFAIDLPDASILIQISGAYGSRQEEAQRLGRILRPKKNDEQALFYSIVTRESKELDFAMKRQLFLTEQGYSYEIFYREY